MRLFVSSFLLPRASPPPEWYRSFSFRRQQDRQQQPQPRRGQDSVDASRCPRESKPFAKIPLPFKSFFRMRSARSKRNTMSVLSYWQGNMTLSCRFLSLPEQQVHEGDHCRKRPECQLSRAQSPWRPPGSRCLQGAQRLKKQMKEMKPGAGSPCAHAWK